MNRDFSVLYRVFLDFSVKFLNTEFIASKTSFLRSEKYCGFK